MHSQIMHNILLVCEILIGIFGIISTIAAEDWHDRVHSIFVVLLATEGFISYFLHDSEHILPEIMLFLITVTAIILAVLSIKPATNHIKKLFNKKKKIDNDNKN